MAYGLTFEQVAQINRPKPIDFGWGRLTACTEVPQYGLHRLEFHPGAILPLHFHPRGEGCIFVEAGEVMVRRLDVDGKQAVSLLRAGEVLPLPASAVHGFATQAGADLYLVGPPVDGGLRFVPAETPEQAQKAVAANGAKLESAGRPTTDRREKYWGRIETILDGDVAGKRIFVRKGGQSSLEFHIEKRETYWVHSGRLKVGLRVGRAENRSIVLSAGESYDIRPGVMHMRIALEDTVIIEASTRDSDADSHLVEDGQTYRHVEVSSKEV